MKHFSCVETSAFYKRQLEQIKLKYSDWSSDDDVEPWKPLPHWREMLSDIEKLIQIQEELEDIFAEDHENSFERWRESFNDRY